MAFEYLSPQQISRIVLRILDHPMHRTGDTRVPRNHNHIFFHFISGFFIILHITLRKYFIYFTGSLIRYTALTMYSRYLGLNFISIQWKGLDYGSLNLFSCIEIIYSVSFHFHNNPVSPHNRFFLASIQTITSELEYYRSQGYVKGYV